MRRAIVTYASGAHEKLLEISLPRFREFGERHGYFIEASTKLIPSMRPLPWFKICMMISALESYDEILWLDADVVILDTSEDIVFPKDKMFALTRHFTAMSEVPNTGVWYMRRTYRSGDRKDALLLDSVFRLEAFTNHGWWEQAALMTLMGYSVPPEGSDFDSTKCRCVYPTEWYRACHFLPVAWNSHPNYRAEKPKIVHCSYPDFDMRLETMKRLVADPSYEYPEWPRKKEWETAR